MVHSCRFAGETMDCARLFTKVPTDSGLCCALNSEQVLKDSQYKDLVQRMQRSENEDTTMIKE